MAQTRDLLIEIGTEELPPKALRVLSESFSSAVCAGLEEQAVGYTIAQPYTTPRRLAVLVRGVAVQQPDRLLERRGPPLERAYNKDGSPTSAAVGFARSCGVEFGALEKLVTEKGSWLVHRAQQAGQPTVSLVPAIVAGALASLPIPKRMRWGNSDDSFVRPVHWVVLLFGTEVIETTLMGVVSGGVTYGHRFHHPQALRLNSAADYAKTLENQGFVIPLLSVRQERIRTQAEQAAEELNGIAVIDEDLLEEVASLVEFPVAVVGSFEEKFLAVPPEALIAAMKGHQRYFHLTTYEGQLLPYFITISNLQSRDPSVVRAGNERVIRPRLSDAMFFWQQDRGQPLAARQDLLKTVVFQKELGTLYDKSERVALLAGYIADELGLSSTEAVRAAMLCKCDLLTQMVGEFPELQGVMGEYYAKLDGEAAGVATAIAEHYLPRFAGDKLPETGLGQVLSIADKVDTLVGIFSINQAPTGDKDPFSLRRAAVGVLRIVIENGLSLNLWQLLQQAQIHYLELSLPVANADEQVFDYMLERLKAYYAEQRVSADAVEAVLACRPAQPFDADLRIRGVEAFRQMPAAVHLASANKRIHNLLKKNEESLPERPDPTYFTDPAERALYDALQRVSEAMQPFLQKGDYVGVLQHLATLQAPVDVFFEQVMVMDKEARVRVNRLAFLQALRDIFLQVADISRLQQE